jgi:hypothetical protein
MSFVLLPVLTGARKLFVGIFLGTTKAVVTMKHDHEGYPDPKVCEACFRDLIGEKLWALYVEHRDTDLHTGDVYVEDCPTCDPEVMDRYVYG